MQAMIDLPDTMTMQDLLDLNIQHFLRDRGDYAWNDATEECAYRTSRGAGCALGIAMTDEEADRADAAVLPLQKLINEEIMPARLRGIDLNFLREIQEVHDACAQEAWRTGEDAKARRLHTRGLHDLALQYGLKWPDDLEVPG